MSKLLCRHPLLYLLIAVVLSSVVVYAIMLQFHAVLPFQRANYLISSHHFLPDPRIDGGPFLFLRALGQYDAQWYLRIAAQGYPAHPTITTLNNKSVMDGLSYAFFPLYPLLVGFANIIFGNLELCAFLIANLLIVLNVCSLYFVIQKLYNPSLAVKTTLLLFLFPFSIFYRSYFAEGLQLLLLIWFAYFLMQKKMVSAAISLGLLNVAKGNAMLINVLYVVYLAQYVYAHRREWPRALLSLCIITVPLLGWILFNYVQTGDPLYFRTVFGQWDQTPFYLQALNNLNVMLHIFRLPFHGFHYSFVDTSVTIFTLLMIVLSWKRLPPVLWWISFLLWLTPFISHDLMSFTRYESVSFPLFLFAALLLKNNKLYIPVATICFISLAALSLFFVNWYWIG
jgi:hypothetical protein